ncbi:MAG TPA: YbaB/EbfC family nucleoid-associated protein [Candidatus Sulfotelmatobacter sp.]|nr:YbaB/EbfC family nucleoid-associated protein [Candidatus Sulfotelmatobacter sp.]
MNNPFSQLGELKKMRDQAMKIQKELQAEEINVEKNGVEILITGDQKIKEIKTNGKGDNDIKEAVNEAVKKSQEVAARKLASMQGGLSGLLGGGGQ